MTKKLYEKPTLEKRSKLSAITAAAAAAVSGGAAGGGAISDRRLKRNIREVQKIASGLKLYAFQYIWSEEVFVGVIAQDLISSPAFSHAVSKLPEGYFQVDYDALGIRMITYDNWLNEQPITPGKAVSNVQVISTN